MRQVRGATSGELGQIAELIDRSFEYDERDLFDYLIAHDPTFEPASCRIAVVDDQIVACTVVLPRQVRARQGWVAGAIVTLVCCDPAWRHQGHGGATVRDALAVAAAQGWGVGILYGVPAYYPQFGFVPVLPRLETALDLTVPALAAPVVAPAGLAAGCRSSGELSHQPEALELRPLEYADLGEACAMYDASLARYPLAVHRTPDPWIWRYRAPDQRPLLALYSAADPGRLRGYAVTMPDAEQQLLAVPEAAVGHSGDAPLLLAALGRYASGKGLTKLRLTLPPGEALIRAALLAGSEQHYRPARAGMAAVLSWEGLLPRGYSVSAASELCHEGKPVLQAGYPELVALVLGYRTAEDVALEPGALQWLVDGAERTAVAERFGPAFPRWSVAPYW